MHKEKSNFPKKTIVINISLRCTVTIKKCFVKSVKYSGFVWTLCQLQSIWWITDNCVFARASSEMMFHFAKLSELIWHTKLLTVTFAHVISAWDFFFQSALGEEKKMRCGFINLGNENCLHDIFFYNLAFSRRFSCFLSMSLNYFKSLSQSSKLNNKSQHTPEIVRFGLNNYLENCINDFLRLPSFRLLFPLHTFFTLSF